MKINSKAKSKLIRIVLTSGFIFWLSALGLFAQETTSEISKVVRKPVKGTFNGTVLIDNQSVMIPVIRSLEFSIQHRFGVINNGYEDFYGIYAPANIRLGFNYVPINNIQAGFGFCKERMLWDGNLKLVLLQQTENWSIPVSITYYGNFAADTRKAENFVSKKDRYSYFHQLLIACKIFEKLSVQISPSISYLNNVEGYYNADSTISPKMYNEHFAIAFSGKFSLTERIGLIANYDQPLTQHTMNNPHPNISFGLEYATSGHAFQLFLGNFQSIVPQYNNFNNQNDYLKNRYLIGFNVTRKFHL